MRSEITALVLTYNEGPNLRRTLERLTWAPQVIVLDSFSQDETEEIARSFPNVRFIQRSFESFSDQCDFGLEQIETDWVLSLDADYVLTDELGSEIGQLTAESKAAAYFCRFRYCIAGVPLRGSLYPPRPVLFRRQHAHYVQDGHAHRLVFAGPSAYLRGVILHDDRKPLARWLHSQQTYARQEANKLLERRRRGGRLSYSDRVRLWLWPAAPAAFLYAMIVKQCLWDGRPGLFYALQRAYFEILLALELLDRQWSEHAVTGDISESGVQRS